MSSANFDTPVSGPSYSRGMRFFALLAVVALLGYGIRRWEVIAAGGWSSPAALVFIAAFFGMAGSCMMMLRAVTTIDREGIRQSGLMDKKMAWNEIRMARVARWGATRLVLRGERGPFAIFYGGNDELRAAFARIAEARRR